MKLFLLGDRLLKKSMMPICRAAGDFRKTPNKIVNNGFKRRHVVLLIRQPITYLTNLKLNFFQIKIIPGKYTGNTSCLNFG